MNKKYLLLVPALCLMSLASCGETSNNGIVTKFDEQKQAETAEKLTTALKEGNIQVPEAKAYGLDISVAEEAKGSGSITTGTKINGTLVGNEIKAEASFNGNVKASAGVSLMLDDAEGAVHSLGAKAEASGSGEATVSYPNRGIDAVASSAENISQTFKATASASAQAEFSDKLYANVTCNYDVNNGTSEANKDEFTKGYFLAEEGLDFDAGLAMIYQYLGVTSLSQVKIPEINEDITNAIKTVITGENEEFSKYFNIVTGLDKGGNYVFDVSVKNTIADELNSNDESVENAFTSIVSSILARFGGSLDIENITLSDFNLVLGSDFNCEFVLAFNQDFVPVKVASYINLTGCKLNLTASMRQPAMDSYWVSYYKLDFSLDKLSSNFEVNLLLGNEVKAILMTEEQKKTALDGDDLSERFKF